MNSDLEHKIQEGFGKVISAAWDDDAFRSRLVADPQASIKELGIEPPDGLNIVVADQSAADVVHFNIPPKPSFDNMELTDEQLEEVAGGEFIIAGIAIGLGVTTAFGLGGALGIYTARRGGSW